MWNRTIHSSSYVRDPFPIMRNLQLLQRAARRRYFLHSAIFQTHAVNAIGFLVGFRVIRSDCKKPVACTRPLHFTEMRGSTNQLARLAGFEVDQPEVRAFERWRYAGNICASRPSGEVAG